MELMRFSVVIAALNEAKNIASCISRARSVLKRSEVIVVHAGSSDNTALIARQCGAIVCESIPCRGKQFNIGAQKSQGEVIIFLHADTLLPEASQERLETFFLRPELKSGLSGCDLTAPIRCLGFTGLPRVLTRC